MFFATQLIVLLFFVGFGPWAQTQSPSESLAWKRYLQFTSDKPHRSLIRSAQFFLDPRGSLDPALEWQTSLARFQGNEKVPSETGPMPLACAWPARKVLLERLSGQRLPSPECPELERWKKALGGHKIWIIYAGAYRDNPASLFGHTFLRFDRLEQGDASQVLRSQSIGFLAETPADDGQVATVVKGLLGFYQGFYNVQPYYMQTALYNNSESRSLWEFELDLTPEERDWALLYLWELSERGAMPYWFLDENCSYQLLAFLEAVRPHATLTQGSGVFVLPLETIRILETRGMLKNQSPVFQVSLRTRLNERLRRMGAKKRALYRRARTDFEVLSQVRDIEVLDALTEYQTYFNYQKKTNLTGPQRRIFEKTFQSRAQLGQPSKDPEITRPFVSPLTSHRPSFWQGGVSQKGLHLQGLMGAHDWVSPLRGLEDVSTIEYAGIEAISGSAQDLRWLQTLLARARNLNEWSLEEPQFSWTLDAAYREWRTDDRWQRGLSAGASYGLSWTSWSRAHSGAILLQGRQEPFSFLEPLQVGWGTQLLYRYEREPGVLAADLSYLIWGSRETLDLKLEILGKDSAWKNWHPYLQSRSLQVFSNSSSHVLWEHLQVGVRFYF